MLLIYLLLPWVCVLAAPRVRGPGALSARVALGLAAYEFLLLSVGVVLGTAGWLRPAAFGTVLGLLAALLAIIAWRRERSAGAGPARGRLRAVLRTRRGAAGAALGAGVALAFAIPLAGDAVGGTRHWDGLWYHVPRALAWERQGSFAPWPTPVWQQIGLPVGADVVLGAKILLGLGWRGTAYVTVALTVGAVSAVNALARAAGLGRWHAAMAAVLFASFPTVAHRVAALNSDLAAAFPVLAAAVALLRMRSDRSALAAFVALNAAALACKPTVVPFAAVIGGCALWSARSRLPRRSALAGAAEGATAGLALLIASYLPVVAAFGDPVGGEVGRAIQVREPLAFARGALIAAVHWLLDPLAYLPAGEWTMRLTRAAYEAVGLKLDQGLLGTTTLADWRPMVGGDTALTGLVPLTLLPVVLVGVSWRARAWVAAWTAAFVVVTGAVYPQPWAGRFMVLLLAAYAFAWAAAPPFRRGRGRWLLTGVATANVGATIALAGVLSWLSWGVQSRPGGTFHYVHAAERQRIAAALAGAPLAVISPGGVEVMIAGPEAEFPMEYILCPHDEDWSVALLRAAARSPGVALVHLGAEQIRAGPAWRGSGAEACPFVAVPLLRRAFGDAGWVPAITNDKLDVWLRPVRATR